MKRLALILAIVLVFSLAGCAGESTPSAPSMAPSAAPSAAPSGAPAGEMTDPMASELLAAPSDVVIIMTSGPEYEMTAKTAEAYNAAYGEAGHNVTVEPLGRDAWQNRLNTTFLAQSDTVDGAITGVQGYGALIAADTIEPLDGYFDKDYVKARGFSKDLFTEPGLNLCSVDGQLYGVPFVSSTIMFFYRTDLIDAPPETLDEMVETAKTFSKSLNPDSPTLYGLASCNRQTVQDSGGYIWSFGGDFFKEDGSSGFNLPGTIEAVKWYSSLFTTGIMPPDAIQYEWATVVASFGNGEVAMASQWDSGAAEWADGETYPAVTDKYAAMIRPPYEAADGTRTTYAINSGWMGGMNKASKQKDALFDFYAYMFTPENYITNMSAGINTFLKDVMASEEYINNKNTMKVTEAFNDCFEFGKPLPLLNPAYNTMEAELRVCVSNIATGADADAEIAKLHQTMEAAIVK